MADVINRFSQRPEKSSPTDNGAPRSEPTSGAVNRFAEPLPDYSGIGEFEAFKATPAQQIKLAAAYLIAPPDEKMRADIIRKTLPGAMIDQDPNNGRYVVTYKGETGYIDKPGITLGGLINTVAQIGKYFPAGKIAAGGATLGTQVLRSFGASALTSAAEDVAAIPLGSEQGISPEKMLFAGSGAATGQALSPLVSKGAGWLTDKGARVWRALRGSPQAVDDAGRLTGIGRRIAIEAGLDPDEVTPELARHLEGAARKATAAGVPDEQIPGATRRQALSDQFDVPLTKGEITQDYAQQSLEENLRKMDVTTRAGGIMRQSQIEAAERLRGIDGGSGFGRLERQIAPKSPPDVSQSGRDILEGTRSAGAAAKEAYRAAYRTAREYGASLDARAYKEFLGGARSALDDVVDFDPGLFPRTANMLDHLAKRAGFMEAAGRAAPRKIPLAKLENLRKTINAEWKSADATDRLGLDVLRNSFDEMVEGALDNGRIIGDPASITAWKDGRSLYRRFRELYAADSRAGAAEKAAGRTVENWLKSEAVTGEEVVAKAISSKAMTARLLKIHGNGSPAHIALKQGALEYVFRPALRGDGISPRLVVSQFERFFRGPKKEQMAAIFSAEDIKLLGEFAELAKAKIPAEGVVNFSNTGNVLVKAMQQLGQKLGLVAASSGNLETAAALSAAHGISGVASTSAAKSAVKGLIPRARTSAPAAAIGGAVGAQHDGDT